MKSCYLLFLALFLPLLAFGQAQMDLPVTFDEANVDYGVADFGGNESMIVVDPTEATNTVAQSTKTAGAMTWGGTTMTSTADGAPVGFASRIPFTVDASIISVRVWSPTAGTPVLLKAENVADGGISVETLTSTTVAGEWETLEFDFKNQAAGTQVINYDAIYEKLSIFFNFGTSPGADETYYWDDVVFTNTTGTGGGELGTQMDLPVTFDDEGVDYGVIAFEGATAMLSVDPTDATNMVAQSTKTADSGTSAGTTVTSMEGGPVGFASRIPLAEGASTMSVRVWSPTAGTLVLLKVEKKDDPTISVETLAATTMAGAWETLVFDFSMERPLTAAINYANTYDKVSIFFGFGSVPAVPTTSYWDDIVFGGEPGGGGDAQMDLPVTFDETGVDYGLADFGGNESMIVADPEDATNTVAQSTKTVGAMTWGGTTLTSMTGGPIGFASRIPFTAEASTMSVRVWSPTAGTPVLLKAENVGDGAISVETLTNTTVAGAWEVLTFDFMNEADGTAAINYESVYDKVSIFFNFGTSPTVAATYYWDDIVFNGAPGGGDTQMDLPVTFDVAGVDYGVADFGGNESMIVADPEDATNTVAQSTKTVGAMTWGGTTLTSTSGGPDGFASRIPFTAEASTMSVRVWSPTAGTPVLLKAENAGDGTISVETLTNTTVAGAWEVLVFNFVNEADGTAAINYASVYDKVSIFFNFGTSPTEAATYYWDDIVFGTSLGTNTPVAGLLEVFPNPVSDRVNITAPVRMTDLTLYDVNGRIVSRHQPGTLRFDLDMSNLKPGFYIALANTAEGAMTVKLLKK